ncbi:hypothetical protein [Pelotomaculum schinkii]|uniref:hypothetical protein n=1 Tax=Pelotomaculum schinkii TaxID=78350 RepID=UPI00167D53DD|nr:hypothetical protein [Pelotomaculum schinkii]
MLKQRILRLEQAVLNRNTFKFFVAHEQDNSVKITGPNFDFYGPISEGEKKLASLDELGYFVIKIKRTTKTHLNLPAVGP